MDDCCLDKENKWKLGPTKAQRPKDALWQPCVGACLQFSPPLQAAYLRTRICEYLHWDQQVAMVECLRLIVLGLDGITKLGFHRTLAAFGPGWVVCLLWLAALQSPAWYKQLRVMLVMLVRVCMTFASMHSNKQLKDQIYADTPFQSPHITLLTRYLLFPHVFSAVLEACSCPTLLLQGVAVAVKAVCLLAGSGAQELIRFGSSPQFIAAAQGLNSRWAGLLQPALPMHVPQHASLAGRSSDVFLGLTTLHITVAGLLTYATYVSLWAQLRWWLRQQLQEAAEAGREYVTVGGVTVMSEDLAAMHSSSAAAAPLDHFSSAWEKALGLVLHVMMVGLVCQAALFISKLAVYQLLPCVLPLHLLHEYYPLCPEGGCVSTAEGGAAGWGLDGAAADGDWGGSWWAFAC